METKISDTHIEKCLLGALLNDPSQLSLVEDILPEGEETFYSTKHQTIYKTIKRLGQKERHDINLIFDECNKYDEVFLSDLTELMYIVPSGELCEHYADRVTDMYWRRTLNKVCLNTIDDVQTSMETITILSNLENTIRRYGDKKKSFRARPIAELAAQSWADYTSKKVSHNIPTGFKDLDERLFLRRGMHVILGARTSMGKTSFAINLATNIATAGFHPLFFSMEQSASSMADCYVAQISGVSRFDYMRGTLSDHEKERVESHAAIWDSTDVHNIGIYDEIMSPESVRHKIITEKQRAPVDVVIVDFLHSMKAPQGTNRNSHEWIREACTQLQGIALEQNVLMITVAQLTRSMNARDDKRPILTDIREAGEDNTDIVMFIYRDEYYNPEMTDERGIAEIIVAKNRHGKTGTIKLKFISYSTAFEDLTEYDKGELI